jgi:hypothetical protein
MDSSQRDKSLSVPHSAIIMAAARACSQRFTTDMAATSCAGYGRRNSVLMLFSSPCDTRLGQSARKDDRVAEIRWERYPRVAASAHPRTWLKIQGDVGLTANTLDAYGRALDDYLAFTANRAIVAETANREHVAAYVRDLARPHPRGRNIVIIDSGTGLANATLQQRLTAVRLFYDYLIEEGIRPTNPVGRGRYTPGRASAEPAAWFRDSANCRGSLMTNSGGLSSLRRDVRASATE